MSSSFPPTLPHKEASAEVPEKDVCPRPYKKRSRMKTLGLGMQHYKECEQPWEGGVEVDSLTNTLFNNRNALAVRCLAVVEVGESSFVL